MAPVDPHYIWALGHAVMLGGAGMSAFLLAVLECYNCATVLVRACQLDRDR